MEYVHVNYYKEILGNYRRILPQLNAEKIRDYAEAQIMTQWTETGAVYTQSYS